MKARTRQALIGSLFILLLGGILVVPQLRWRAHVVYLQVSGQIPDLPFGVLLKYITPGSDQSMTRLISTHNPYAVIRNFHTSEADLEAGASLFHQRCASCHGTGGAGGTYAPAFVGQAYVQEESDWAVYRTIRYGVAGTGMAANPDLGETDLWQLVTYLRSVGTRKAVQAIAAEPRISAEAAVPYSELQDLEAPGDDWLTYSGSYRGTRHSALSQVDAGNVSRLRVSWIHQFDGQPVIEASPLVHDGIMYMSVPPCSVLALDASTGRTIWTWTCKLSSNASGEHTGVVSRGVALLKDMVYVSTWDARLFALDARTGKERWHATVSENPEIYYISGAPLALRNLVVTGVSTRQVGRGFVAAFDADTGTEQWRFTSIPGPGEPGHDTWAGDSWKVGGGPMWLTGSYDANADLLYWGVGNPKPDYDKEARRGDNLYTNSVVALRGSTGELVWHFQFTPGDDHDWDSAQIPVLVDYGSGDAAEKRILWANRNGYYYVLDRLTGEFLLGKPFVHQSWNAGLDSTGRPIPLPEKPERIEGTLVHPSNTGGTSWWSPTYDPQRNLMIVPVLERGMIFFPSLLSWPQDTGRPFYTAVRALDASSGDLVWEYRRPPRNVDNSIGGLLSVDGGVVFGSDQTTFFALDTDSGELLMSVETGGKIVAAPVTYAVDGVQQVSITAGGDLLTFALPGSEASLAGADD